MHQATAIDMRHDLEHSCFVATVEGEDAVVRYRIDGDVMHVLSTHVPATLEGRGIAAALTHNAIAYAAAHQLRVDPVCSYTAAYLRRHGRDG